MGVKGHVDIPRIHRSVATVGAQAGHETVGVQHDLAVAENDPLGQSCGSVV